MYIPSHFAESDPAPLREFMRRHSFATLVTTGPGGLSASHLPILTDSASGSNGHLFGHMARANPQWRDIEGDVMVVFAGPHAYVSPSWYEQAGTVPTWNYVAVHAYGTLHIVDDRDQLLDILRRSVQAFEGGRSNPWRFDESDPSTQNLLKAIVGFRIAVHRLEGKWKLSQNHPEERRRKVTRALQAQGDENSLAIARLMSERFGYTLPA